MGHRLLNKYLVLMDVTGGGCMCCWSWPGGDTATGPCLCWRIVYIGLGFDQRGAALGYAAVGAGGLCVC